MRYLHTMLRVRNLDVALKFYQDALGLKEVRRIENEKGRFTLVFLCSADDLDALKKQPQTRGAPLVELTWNWDEEKYGEDRFFGHLAYEVDDIYATCEKLMKAARRQHGLRPLAGPALDRAATEGRPEAAAGALAVDAQYRPLVRLSPQEQALAAGVHLQTMPLEEDAWDEEYCCGCWVCRSR
jgi:lactoylglutathione lyase